VDANMIAALRLRQMQIGSREPELAAALLKLPIGKYGSAFSTPCLRQQQRAPDPHLY